ncbi:MAG: leucine-rich repeat domain-containing protein [Dehalococcoidales bacterium]|nr:leucine-rich repeat domain-containing protein [Dehalococcoidales bacterium]
MDRVKTQSIRIAGAMLVIILIASLTIWGAPVHASNSPTVVITSMAGDNGHKDMDIAPADYGDEPVVFPDPGLENAIRDKLGNYTDPIYQSDLLMITDLNANDYGIYDLSGIEYCTSLIDLQLRGNSISELSPLSSMSGLFFLDLGDNQISNISPLAGLYDLISLCLDNNQITDISDLTGMSDLSWLTLGSNQIAEISCLSVLTDLALVFLDDNCISDISSLVSNSGLDTGDYVCLAYNHLYLADESDSMQDINTLVSRGVTVDYLPQKEVSPDIIFLLQGTTRPEEGWLVPVTVKFFTAGTEDVLTDAPLYLFEPTAYKEDGKALVHVSDIVPGMYDITLVTQHCLTNVKRGVEIDESVTEVDMGTLLEGDADDDDNIDIHDFGLLASTYDTARGEAGYDERADFDRSGRTNIADFGLLALNYGLDAPIELE